MTDQDAVDIALSIVDQDAADAGDFLGRQHAVDQTLAAEVRRLRSLAADLEFQRKDAVAEVNRLRVIEQRFELGQRSLQNLSDQLAERNAQLSAAEKELRKLRIVKVVFDPEAVRVLVDAIRHVKRETQAWVIDHIQAAAAAVLASERKP